MKLWRPVVFAAITAILVLFTAASSTPSPLYVVYQQEWSFSPTTLTVVFAIYVLGLLGSLLVFGALSDHLGRRPVLAAAIALEAAALVLFIVADGVTVLAVARVAQGIATGAALTTLGAALVDLNPPHAPGRAGLVNGVARPERPRGRRARLRRARPVRAVADAPRLRPAARRDGARSAHRRAHARDVDPPPRCAELAAAARRDPAAPARPGLRARADPRRELGARRPLPLARPVGRGKPLRPAQPPRRRPRRDAAVRHRRGDSVRPAHAADRRSCSRPRPACSRRAWS